MAVLVRDHVGLRQCRAADAEPGLQLVEETEIDVHELVARAVERTDLRVGGPARGVHLAAEEDGVDVLVLPVAALEDAVPELLDAVDDRDDPAVLRARSHPVPSCRPVEISLGVSPWPDLLVVERRELAKTAAVRKQRDQDVDDEPDETEPAAADSETARADAATAGVRYLAGIERSITSKAHRAVSCLVPPSANSAAPPRQVRLAARAIDDFARRALVVPPAKPRWHVMVWATGCRSGTTATIARAAAVEVCEPRQGREAAALSIPSRRRGYLEKSASLREP